MGLIELILALAVTATLVKTIILLFSNVVSWFRERSKMRSQNPNNIAVTVSECLANGNYNTVQGIFNKGTKNLIASRRVESEGYDSELSKAHSGNKLVIWE